MEYKAYDCDQISAEVDDVEGKSSELYGKLKETAETDSAQMALGMIFFWPALFFLEGGDGPEAAEYARLKGERDALQKVSIQKKCGIERTIEANTTKTEEEDVDVDV